MGCAKFYFMDSSLNSIQRVEHARVALCPLPSRRATLPLPGLPAPTLLHGYDMYSELYLYVTSTYSYRLHPADRYLHRKRWLGDERSGGIFDPVYSGNRPVECGGSPA